MIDLKALQNDFEGIANKLQKKKVDSELLETLKEQALALKAQKSVLEELQAIQNSKSKLFPQYQKEGKDIAALKEELAVNKQKIATEQEKARDLEASLANIALNVPNIPDSDVPEGLEEEDNVEIKKVLDVPTFSFTPKEHWDFEELDFIDFERGVKLSKSRFSVLKNDAARIERALINYMLDFNRKRGFAEVSVPYIVNRDSLMATGQLPKFEDDLFKIEDEELFLIPTAEVPLTNLY